MKNIFTKFIYVIFVLIIVSCVKDIDFDQAEDFSITPVLVSSIAYSDLKATKYVKNGIEVGIVTDTISDIEIFKNDFLKDNLVRAEIELEILNTIQRGSNTLIKFLDTNNNLKHSFNINIPTPINGNEVKVNHIEVFDIIDVENLKETTKIVFVSTLQPSTDGSSLNVNSTGRKYIKLAGKFFFNIKN